jgi:hypothetical protein
MKSRAIDRCRRLSIEGITRTWRSLLFLIAAAAPAFSAVTVQTERLDSQGEWAFKSILRPSRSDIGRDSHITLAGAEKEMSGLSQGWGSPQKNRSVGDSPLRIGGVDYPAGLGTHAPMNWAIELDGQGVSFSALVGMQDLGEKEKGSVEFLVLGEGKVLFKSGILRSGDKAVPVKVDLAGAMTLTLQVTDAGVGTNADHADWIAPEIVHTGALQ